MNTRPITAPAGALPAKLRLLFAAALGLLASTLTAAPAPVSSILFIGDSITLHSPAAQLGWEGRWGMAASREDLDYVHRLVARFAKTQGKAPAFVVHAEGGGTIAGKLQNPERITQLAKGANLIVLQLGENDREVTVAGFQEPYDELIKTVRQANPAARIICLGTWAPPSGSPVKDNFIRDLCARNHLSFADTTEANKDPLNRALSTGQWTHAGVNWHPSDAGMDAYAAAIWKAYTADVAAIPAAAARPTPSSHSAPSNTKVLYQETFKAPDAATQWAPGPGVIGPGERTNAVKLTNATSTQTVYYRHKLDAAAFAGRRVVVSARIKGENITAPPKPYNGIKLMLTMTNAEGARDYPQAPAAFTETFGWREVSFTKAIPDNTVDIILVLGLENAAGTIWFEDIKITLAP